MGASHFDDLKKLFFLQVWCFLVPVRSHQFVSMKQSTAGKTEYVLSKSIKDKDEKN